MISEYFKEKGNKKSVICNSYMRGWANSLDSLGNLDMEYRIKLRWKKIN